MTKMNIGRSDVIWNYIATFLQIGVGIILLPFILRAFSQETVAIWTIFATIVTLIGLLDFGFNPSFARNVSYVVSGVKELKTTGYNIVESHGNEIDYSLFKGLIDAMRWFYRRMASILFLILATAGTYYIYIVLKNYSGNSAEVYIAWGILVIINTWSLYTMYYDSLMQGQGLIKRAKQIQMTGQSIYLAVAVVLILLRFNLIAIVSAQALSIVIKRTLSHRAIYTDEFKNVLHTVKAQSREKILKSIYPNAMKLGLTTVGNTVSSRSAIIIGSLYLSLETIASYGITFQIASIIAMVARVYFLSYQPKIVQYRIWNDNAAIKYVYLKSCRFLLATFVLGGGCFIVGGEWALDLIGSKTPLLSKSLIVLTLFFFLLEDNRTNAGEILLTKNEVPFVKSELFTGVFTVILLFTFMRYTDLGVLGMLIAPLIVQSCYQNWKWPTVVIKELNRRSSITGTEL
jgi:O-antigen/teichoic acid export membrane protein